MLVAFAVTAVAAGLAFDFTTRPANASVSAPWAQNRMQFVSWNDQRWTAWIRDNVFEQLPEDTANWSRHAKPSLAYIDWDGEPWQAKIDGDNFILAHRGDWKGPTESANAIRYKDWLGHNKLRTVAQLRR